MDRSYDNLIWRVFYSFLFQSKKYLFMILGHFKIVELLSELLPNICPKDHLGDTPLHLAARSGHLSIVKYFMGRVEEKHPKNSFGYTPLHKASRKGHLQVVGYLSDNFIPNDDMRNVWGETPLSYLP